MYREDIIGIHFFFELKKPIIVVLPSECANRIWLEHVSFQISATVDGSFSSAHARL